MYQVLLWINTLLTPVLCTSRMRKLKLGGHKNCPILNDLRIVEPGFEVRCNGSRARPFNTVLEVSLFVGKEAQSGELQPVARCRGNISEGDRDRLGRERMTRTGPCSHPQKSYLDRRMPRACHPSVMLVYNVPLEGGGWGVLDDHCSSGWTEEQKCVPTLSQHLSTWPCDVSIYWSLGIKQCLWVTNA